MDYFDISTGKGLTLRVLVVSVVTVVLAVAASELTVLVWFHFDLNAIATGWDALWLAGMLSFCTPAVLAPIITWRAALLMRDLKNARDAYAHLSRIDELTGLPNRRGVDLGVSERLGDADHMMPVAALMIDVDHFKAFNDKYGHAFGDATLRHVAEALRRATDGVDAIVGRQGGDEFIVVIPGADEAATVALAECLRREVAAHQVERREEAPITLSIGVACGSAALPFSRLAGRADAALLAAKRRGRDCVHVEELDEPAAA